MKRKYLSLLLVTFLGCIAATLLFADESPTAAQLESQFANPPMEYRPLTRYWWFGGAVTRPELARELTGMKDQGLAGVEIQSLYDALPAVPGHKTVLFASPEWVNRVATCMREAAKLGMKVDLTPGSGWPYAGPWVDNDHAGQSLASQAITMNGPGQQRITFRPKGPVIAVTLRREGADGPAQVLTNSLSPDGETSIAVDEGKWVATCFWAKLGGFGPHKRANRRDTGPVLDHLSASAMDFQLNHCALPVLNRVGDLVGSTFGSLFIDSWELGKPTWTTDFLQQFRARRGYDLAPYLDLIATKNGSATARQVQHDYDQTLRDLITEDCYGELTRWSHQHGLQSRAQAHGSPSDWEDSYGMADIPEFEIDFKHPHVPIGADLALAAAHVYGHPLVSCESFTWLTEHWRMTMHDLREEADLIFVSGANQLVFHGYSYSPPAAGFPGWDFYAACEIDHNNPFWPYFRPLADYMARNCLLLRSGQPVADVAVYGTESSPQGPNWLSDRVTDRVLMHDAYMDGDRLAAGFGHYRVLVLDTNTMPLATMERIRSFVEDGLTVIASQLPSEVPTFKDHDAQTANLRQLIAGLFPDSIGTAPHRVGKGSTYLVDKSGIPTVLPALGIETDLTADGDLRVRWLHREGPDYDLYLLNNPSAEKPVCQTFSFRSKGCLELWNAHNGKLEPASYRVDGARVVANVTLGPKESRLVMIRRDKPATGSAAIVELSPKTTLELGGPWRVEFRHIDGRKPFERDFPQLIDWTRHDGLRHFAGTAIYHGQFRLSKSPRGDVSLDLGQVDDVASVIVNGKTAGIVYETPFRVEVTGLVHAGENEIEIKVANRAENAIAPVIAAWKGPGKWPGYFFVNRSYKTYAPDDAEVHPSGLLGPVRLQLF